MVPEMRSCARVWCRAPLGPLGVGLFLVSLLSGAVTGAPTPAALRERGVLFYVPFEGSPDAAIAMGRAGPWAQRALSFVPGKIGQALHVRSEEARYVTDGQGKVVKDTSGQSVIAYEALGNVLSRRGTIAFWVRTPWAGTDRDLLTGASFSGPYVLSVSAEGTWKAFCVLWRRKSFFDCYFEGERKAGDLARLGTYGQKLVPLWQKDVWQHVAITWDDRRGYALLFNGEVVDAYDQPIAWDLNTPDIIALGTFPLRGRDVWPVSSEFLFDEFLIFNRPLNAAEVKLVMNGQYGDLRLSTPEDWPFDPDARRRQFNLEPAPNRPTVELGRATGVEGREGSSIRQLHVEEVAIPFHLRYTLIDGTEDTEVRFRDGGLLFDVPAQFQFRRPETFNRLVTSMSNPNGSFCYDDPARPLRSLGEGRTHVALAARQRRDFGIFFKGDCTAREVRFFDLGPPGKARPGTPHFIAEPMAANRFEDAGRILLRWPHPGDQPALLTAGAAPDRQQVLTRRALQHTFFVLDAAKADRCVEALRLLLWIRPAGQSFTADVRLYDPQIPGRVAFDLDIEVRAPRGTHPVQLDLRVSAPGIVVPAGGRAVLHLIADVDYELLYGGNATPSRIEVTVGDQARIGHELAQASLLNLWPAYLRRINQNRFMAPGETEETNPIKRALDLALKYDPTNERAQAWYGWSRLRPWPAYDFSRVEKQPGPRWAVYGREAIRSAQAIIHWWLDHRAHPNGYLVGGGNQWNDITQLYENFSFLCGVTGDPRLLDAMERYLDAHWNTGRMVRGYFVSQTDITHSAEEASLLQPHLAFLRPGVPRHVYRDLLTAANLQKWMGVNARGHTHFRSNFFTAERMDTTGVFGQDIPGCEAAATQGRAIAWYNGHPELSKLLADYSRSWLEDTLRGEGEKLAGAVPAAVQFESDQLIGGWASPQMMLDQFLAAFQLTGDRQFLHPFEMLLEKREALGNLKWYNHHALNLVTYRLLSGDARRDELLRRLAAERIESCRRDDFFQRGIESAEGEGLMAWVIDHNEDDLLELLKYVARNNRRALPIYGPTDPPTDRVYPWGRAVLPVMMLGGRLLDSRASDPLPTAAFIWEDTDPDVVSLVFRHDAKSVALLVHNFKPRPVNAGLRLLRLPEGAYRISTAPDRNADRKPDTSPAVRETEMRRFTPTTLRLPAGTTFMELTCLRERPHVPRPDLAITVAEPPKAGRLAAQVHNLGCATARNVVVQILGKEGQALATQSVAEAPALVGFQPQVMTITFALPAGVPAEQCSLIVDPGNQTDEVNESNNRYPVATGVPPPVESSPGEPMF